MSGTLRNKVLEKHETILCFKFAACQKYFYLQHLVRATITEAGNVIEVFVVHERKDLV